MALQVRSVPVSTKRMALTELNVRPAKTEQVRSVEASLRLDAVASAGFRISRAKVADLIKAGDVRWGCCSSTALGYALWELPPLRTHCLYCIAAI
jgi:RNA-binding protein YlmH